MVAGQATVEEDPARADEPVTRDRLLRSAIKAFSASGFEGVTVRDIERRAKVNRGVIAYHFGSKQQLWDSCLDDLMAECHSDLQRYRDLLQVVSRHERRRVLLKAFVEFVVRRPEFFRMLVIDGGSQQERAERVVLGLRKTMRFFDGFAGRASADPQDDAAAAFLFLGAVSLVFAVPAQCRYLFGFEPGEGGFPGRFSDALIGLGVFGPGKSEVHES